MASSQVVLCTVGTQSPVLGMIMNMIYNEMHPPITGFVSSVTTVTDSNKASDWPIQYYEYIGHESYNLKLNMTQTQNKSCKL
jgi:hypothetical protein